tara:strand:- start:94 stop:303 length:210 start_codon:yes stop_codon:yes gene_type:complete
MDLEKEIEVTFAASRISLVEVSPIYSVSIHLGDITSIHPFQYYLSSTGFRKWEESTIGKCIELSTWALA